jgi:hypothetical protein
MIRLELQLFTLQMTVLVRLFMIVLKLSKIDKRLRILEKEVKK